jgi:NADH-quinone oxidoreductase subunit M
VLAGLFLIAGLAGLSLPGLSTFVSEFLVLVGTFTRYEAAAVLATLGIILAAIYILWMYQRTMTGPVRPEVASMPDLKPRELWAVGPLIALIVVLGIYPKPVLNIINPAVQSTLSGTHSTDPVPPHPTTPVSPVGAGSAATTSLLLHHNRVPGLAQATRMSVPALSRPALSRPALSRLALSRPAPSQQALKQGSSG